MISSEQSRAARGWLNWSQSELARRANVSMSTVCDFEKDRRIPSRKSMLAIRTAFEDAGVRLSESTAGITGPLKGIGQ